MNDNPLISVIMPTYNAEEYIEEAIISVLSQTYSEFEFLIINDASTDKTVEKIEAFQDPRIRLIHNEDNLKLPGSLNKGLEAARGKYIARMDADDIALPYRFETQLNFLEHNQNYVLVASQIETFSHSPAISDQDLWGHQNWWNTAVTDEQIKGRLLLGNCLNHPSVMYRKQDVIEEGKYRNEYNCAEDYDLFMRLRKRGKYAKTPYPLLKYRIHPGQISQKLRQNQREIDAQIKGNYLKEEYCPEQSRIVVWGASGGGELITKALLERNMNIIGFIDRNQNLWGSKLLGIEVLGNENSLQDIDFDFIVIASSKGRHYASEYLTNKGFAYGKDFMPIWF